MPEDQSRWPEWSLNLATLALMYLLCWPMLWGADGKHIFSERCAGCHGSYARGTGKAPGLVGNPRLSGQSVEQLAEVVKRGFPSSGMPAFDLPADELNAVASYVQALNAGVTPEIAQGGNRVTWGQPKLGDWLTYNGKPDANRYSELKQIQYGECRQLAFEVDLLDPSFRPGVWTENWNCLIGGNSEPGPSWR
jgi:cytochrome c553